MLAQNVFLHAPLNSHTQATRRPIGQPAWVVPVLILIFSQLVCIRISHYEILFFFCRCNCRVLLWACFILKFSPVPRLSPDAPSAAAGGCLLFLNAFAVRSTRFRGEHSFACAVGAAER